jgi:threonine/homoserine/homoserine lactone efflux protein
VFLGWQAWRSPAPPASASNTAKAASARRLFRDGAWVALLNPKTALFFGAFLPQFIGGSHPAEGASAALTVTLGGLFIVIAAVTDSLYALVAGKLRPLLEGASRSRRFGARLSGSVLIGLGLFTAYSGTSSP